MAAPDTEHAPEVNVTRARQGRRGVHMFWVLVISTLLTAAVFAVIWMVSANRLGQVNGQAGADQPSARSFDSQVVPQTPQQPTADAVPTAPTPAPAR
jgi:hypothetical protein